ncbi:Uu.00g145220.m01.CDS01 [Anthostomella pinea]|uniref:Uu.00g145220.m01.CDS01 n=1 Tax=Anthostomella pinea TaxID=933095 RepID=A0AAI8YJF6_9PEZI|nr:Uu.00g145220.m01.CDS01 [Anthostomella pinea]
MASTLPLQQSSGGLITGKENHIGYGKTAVGGLIAETTEPIGRIKPEQVPNKHMLVL